MRLKKKDKTKKYVAGGILPYIPAAAQAIFGISQMARGQKMANQLAEPSTEKPSEYADMLKLSRNREVEERRLDELNRNLATGIAAAQAGGGRALVGSLPGMVRAGDQGAINLMGKRQADQMRALQIGAMGSEREINRNIAAYQRDLGAAQAAIEGGIQNIAGGLGQAGLMALYSEPKKKSVAVDDEPEFEMTEEQRGALNQIQRQAEEDRLKDIDDPRKYVRRPDTDDEYKDFQYDNQYNSNVRRMAKGGKMTKGAFNHDTNPIDIVQKGVKVGEMTGGEVILNPKQQAKLSKESSYFRSLLKKFNKNK
tara:strand:- start:1500 stop:2429 length:930 start_codon:yes stop_codon:yes gene_type:complete